MTVFWDDLFYHAFRIHSESRLAFSPRCAEPRDRAFVFHVQVKCVAIYYCQLLSTCVGYKCNWNLINTQVIVCKLAKGLMGEKKLTMEVLIPLTYDPTQHVKNI